ncbi:hypothetical protein HDU96_000011 [Phlyctochytrium bullatum]|nr:hypothetical protein HDU96_000011 [Phlyctochytrium bullatum]
MAFAAESATTAALLPTAAASPSNSIMGSVSRGIMDSNPMPGMAPGGQPVGGGASGTVPGLVPSSFTYSLSGTSPMEVDDPLDTGASGKPDHIGNSEGSNVAGSMDVLGKVHGSDTATLNHHTTLPLPPQQLPTTPHPTPSFDGGNGNLRSSTSPPAGLVGDLPSSSERNRVAGEPPPHVKKAPALYFVNSIPPSISQRPAQLPPPIPPTHDPSQQPPKPDPLTSHHPLSQYPYHLKLSDRWSRVYQPLTAEVDLLSLFSLNHLRVTDQPPTSAPPGASKNQPASKAASSLSSVTITSSSSAGPPGSKTSATSTLAKIASSLSKPLLPQDPEGKTYLSYLRDLPGKLEVVKDKNLRDAILAPPKGDPIPIRTFDEDTLISAFTVKPGPMPGFDASVLGTERFEDVVDKPTVASRPQPPSQTATGASGQNGAATGASASEVASVKTTIKLKLGADYKAEEAASSPNVDSEKKKKKKKRKHEGEGDDDLDADGVKKKKKKKKHKGEDHPHHNENEMAQ